MSAQKDTIRTINRIFNARSVALVGASNDPHKYGYMTLNSIIQGGYEGDIYPVNPKAREILGLKTYASLSEIRATPDLVIIIVPVNLVAGILREAGERGVPGALIATGGFREAGRKDLEEELSLISKEYQIRVIGPNIAGINYLPNKLCAMFFPVITTFGPLGIISQSGTVTNGLSEWAAFEGLGISAAINLGNQMDLCESDFLDFLAADKSTKSIAMYLEGVEDGRRFLESLQLAVSVKPVVILKGGRTDLGQRSAASHTGSMATNYNVFKSACSQYGAVMADDLGMLYDFAKALATMRPPKGNRVFCISTSGGANTTAVDEAAVRNLLVPKLPDKIVDQLRNLEFSPLAAIDNPFDLVSLSAEDFRKAVSLVDQLDLADMILLNFGDPVVGASQMTKKLVARTNASVAVSYFAGGDEEKVGRVEIQAAGIPVFSAPERAMRGISAAAWVANYHRERPSGQRDHKINLSAFQKMTFRKGAASRFLTEPEGIQIVRQYGIPYPTHGIASTADDAVEIAERIGHPVVMKIVSPDIPHKTEAGCVLLGLMGNEEVRNGFTRLYEQAKKYQPSASIEGILVCEVIPEGLEVIVGAIHDAVFGPTIMFGLGGIFAEVFQDVAFRIAPVEEVDIRKMIVETRAYPLLVGTRGLKKADLDGVVRLIKSVSRLIVERDDIAEIDLNPIRVLDKGIMALDVRILTVKEEWASSGVKAPKLRVLPHVP